MEMLDGSSSQRDDEKASGRMRASSPGGTVSAAIVRLGDRRSTSSLDLIVMAASSSGVRPAPICGEEERRNHLEEERGGYKCSASSIQSSPQHSCSSAALAPTVRQNQYLLFIANTCLQLHLLCPNALAKK